MPHEPKTRLEIALAEGTVKAVDIGLTECPPEMSKEEIVEMLDRCRLLPPQIVWPPPGFRIKESEYVLHPMEADGLIQRLTVRVELETVPVVPPPNDSEPIIVEG